MPRGAKAQRAVVLEELQTAARWGRGVTTARFLDLHIPRFGARIYELRNEGYKIETRKYDGGAEYVLLPDATTKPEVEDESRQRGLESPPAGERNSTDEGLRSDTGRSDGADGPTLF